MVDFSVKFFENPQSIYVLGFVLFLWLIFLSFWLFRLHRHYQRLVKGVTASDLRGIWLEHLAQIDKARRGIEILNSKVGKMNDLDKIHLQKVSLVRFNPFSDTGGDQSFSLALLNDHGDGLVLSSLHGRSGTRVYAKSIKGFEGDGHELSLEEEQAINYAARF